MAALPSHPCHTRMSIPTLELPMDGDTGSESLTEGASWRVELCRGHAGCWHSTGFLLEPQMDTKTSVRANASPALPIASVGYACLVLDSQG